MLQGSARYILFLVPLALDNFLQDVSTLQQRCVGVVRVHGDTFLFLLSKVITVVRQGTSMPRCSHVSVTAKMALIVDVPFRMPWTKVRKWSAKFFLWATHSGKMRTTSSIQFHRTKGKSRVILSCFCFCPLASTRALQRPSSRMVRSCARSCGHHRSMLSIGEQKRRGSVRS